MKTLIIQASFPRSASTVLVNAVHGAIPELFSRPVYFSDFSGLQPIPTNQNIIVIKTHETQIDDLSLMFADKYKLYFICSERAAQNKKFPEKYRYYPNVVIFDFDELNTTSANVAHNVYRKMKYILTQVSLNQSLCLRRLEAMNRRYEQIKSMPFDYVDPYFNIHGSHRSRPVTKNLRHGGY